MDTDFCTAATLSADRLAEGVRTDPSAVGGGLALLTYVAEADSLGMPGAGAIARSLVGQALASATPTQRLDLAARLDALGLHDEAERVFAMDRVLSLSHN